MTWTKRTVAALVLLAAILGFGAPTASALLQPGFDKRQWLCPFLTDGNGKRTELFCLPLPFDLPI